MPPIYLDHIAATKPHPDVVAAMLLWLSDEFGNPLSLQRWGEKPREAGERAREGVERAREQVARLIHAEAREITFTGSGTEANHLALRGLTTPLRRRGAHVVISRIEHPSVLAPARRMEENGATLTLVPVDRHGVVDPGAVATALRSDTVLVSIQLANPEIGTIQPIAQAARIARERRVLVHTAAVAARRPCPLHH